MDSPDSGVKFLGRINLSDFMATECTDKKCFMHGSLRVRGGRLTGKVVSTKGKHTVIIERSIIKFIPKYRRWAREHSRIAAHSPACMLVKLGEQVRIGETRKISKTKSWTVTEIIGKETGGKI